MKANELKAVTEAVRLNVSNFKTAKGENTLEGLDGFTPSMLNAFDHWYDMEVANLLS